MSEKKQYTIVVQNTYRADENKVEPEFWKKKKLDEMTQQEWELLCDGCGDLADLPVVGLLREIENAIGTEVRSYALTIHYFCPKCRQKDEG